MAEERPGPRYEGVTRFTAKKDGYALWLPSGWHRFGMGKGHHGVIFSPYEDDLDTSFSAEKRTLRYKTTRNDLPTLREGFSNGLRSLPGVQIESEDDVVEAKIMALDARLTFLEGEQRRKRWVRVIYAGEAQLTLIAQGRTAEDFDYWLPMFFNTMMTLEI